MAVNNSILGTYQRSKHLALLSAPVFVTLLLVALVPLGRPLERFAGSLSDSSRFGFLLVFILAASAVLYRQRQHLSWPSLRWTIVFSLVISVCSTLFVSPIETAHLPLFALLALSARLCWKLSTIRNLIFCFAVAWLDEGLQYFHPERVFDLKDLALNMSGSLLGVLPWKASGKLR